MKFQKVVRLRSQTHAVSAKHAERNEVKRSMISGNFEIFLIISPMSTFIYSLKQSPRFILSTGIVFCFGISTTQYDYSAKYPI